MDTLDRKLKEDIIQLINNVSFERIIYSNIKNKKQVLKGIDPFCMILSYLEIILLDLNLKQVIKII